MAKIHSYQILTVGLIRAVDDVKLATILGPIQIGFFLNGVFYNLHCISLLDFGLIPRVALCERLKGNPDHCSKKEISAIMFSKNIVIITHHRSQAQQHPYRP